MKIDNSFQLLLKSMVIVLVKKLQKLRDNGEKSLADPFILMHCDGWIAFTCLRRFTFTKVNFVSKIKKFKTYQFIKSINQKAYMD